MQNLWFECIAKNTILGRAAEKGKIRKEDERSVQAYSELKQLLRTSQNQLSSRSAGAAAHVPRMSWKRYINMSPGFPDVTLFVWLYDVILISSGYIWVNSATIWINMVWCNYGRMPECPRPIICWMFQLAIVSTCWQLSGNHDHSVELLTEYLHNGQSCQAVGKTLTTLHCANGQAHYR